jgi:hypothetical protein
MQTKLWMVALVAGILSAGAALAQELPVARVETVAKPVVTSRLFVSGLAPNTRGGWTWIGEFMNYSSTNKPKHKVDMPGGGFYYAYDDVAQRPEAEWVVADLATGTSKVVKWPGFHGGPTCLAPNGRLFFGVDYAHLYYYDPAADTVKTAGCVKDSIIALRWFYRLILGPDELIYGSAQTTNGVTVLMRLNPDTLEYKLFENVGLPGRRKDLTYGYYLAVDPPWMYVAVGQGNWELFAVNADTGETKCLADVQGEGCRITVTQGADFCTASVTTKDQNTSYTLVDGQALAGATPKATPVSQKKYTKVEWRNTKPMDISNPPELDAARPVEVGAQGAGGIHWRPAGSTVNWKTVGFAIENAMPVRIERLTLLPDGSLLGNGYSYQGFFRYYPQTKKLDYFGKHGPETLATAVCDGKVWICGYPNVNLSVYDPAKPWTSKKADRLPGGAPAVNPQFIDYFGQGCTEAHRCSFLLAPGNGRIYICGTRERWSTGTGLGYYDVATAKKLGLGTANKEVDPAGFIALPKLNRLVFSGSGKTDGRLVIYDMDLNEIERVQLKGDLTNTGALYATDSDDRFLGVYTDPATKKQVLYLYDLSAKKMVHSVELAGEPGLIFRRADGTYWLIMDAKLLTVNTETLTLTPICMLDRGFGFPTWVGQAILGSAGGELVRTTVPGK